MWCDVMWCDLMWHTQQDILKPLFKTWWFYGISVLMRLYLAKYPLVITQGRIFIGGVVVNSSKANILHALWKITLAWAWVRLGEVTNRSGGCTQGKINRGRFRQGLQTLSNPVLRQNRLFRYLFTKGDIFSRPWFVKYQAGTTSKSVTQRFASDGRPG